MTHSVTCNCGESFQESHDYYIDKLGRRCNKCGYFTKELTPVPITPSQICDIESIIKREDGF